MNTSQRIRQTRIVVLGGAGFLGSHLCERLLADGASEVICVDNFVTGAQRNVEPLLGHGDFRLIRHDITQPMSMQGEVDFVFNLASPASPIDHARLPIETLRVGAIGTENALLLAEDKGAVLLQASTSEIYGDPEVQHVNPIGPRSVYDEAKRYGEALVAAFHRSRGVKTRIARIFDAYGPRMRLEDGRVVPTLVSQALRGEDFTVFGDGRQTRSFCFVSDLIDGLVRLACSDVNEPVNLGNPREMTILELAETVARLTAGKSGIIYKPLPENDPKQRQLDIRRARTLLGWEPEVSVEDGLRETIEYFRSVQTAEGKRARAPEHVAQPATLL